MTITQGAQETTVVNVDPGAVSKDLISHLTANRMYYAHAIFRSLDSVQIAQMLAGYGYKINGKLVPVSQIVEPMPIRYIGNYLAFKTNLDSESTGVDPDWDTFVEERKVTVGSTKNDTVPLGTGGVFAEAVLGRSNCAETLDATRFWDWKVCPAIFNLSPHTEHAQDSPPPLAASDIAAIQTGSRGMVEDTKAGQLSTPIINITSPSSLPDPSGTAGILAAIQNGTMFRDQSGLAATIGLTQAALQATQAGAAAAGQQAGQNLANQLAATTERQRTAAAMITDLAKTAASVYTAGLSGGGASSTGSGGKTGSQQGALINYFDKKQGQSATPSEATSGAVAGGSSGGSSSSSGGGGGSAPANGVVTASARGNNLGFSQNPAARAAVGGSTDFMDTLMSKVDGVLGIGSDAKAAPLGTRKAWPNLAPTTVLSRIKVLANNANKFDQGGFGLCTGAAFFHVIIRTDGPKFESFANALYGGGIGFLGDLKVDPDYDLRSADYTAIMARLDKKYNPPPQADWMLMCSIRDSENWLLDFEGAPDDSAAMETATKELGDWFRKTGWYQAPVYKRDPSLDDLRNIPSGPGIFTLLAFKVQMLEPNFAWTKGDLDGHIISVLSKIEIDEPNDKVSFMYWTWGYEPRKLETNVASLKTNVTEYLTVTKL